MPSRPLSADRSASVKLHTRIDVEAIDIAKDRTDMPAAVPPARLDLVDNALVAVGRRNVVASLDWPPVGVVHELIHRFDEFADDPTGRGRARWAMRWKPAALNAFAITFNGRLVPGGLN